MYLFLSDAIPYLGWLDLRGYEKKMKSTAKELDNFIAGWLEEHKKKRLTKEGGKGDEDFMDVMLTILEDAQISGFDVDIINKATCLVSTHLIIEPFFFILLTFHVTLNTNNDNIMSKLLVLAESHFSRK